MILKPGEEYRLASARQLVASADQIGVARLRLSTLLYAQLKMYRIAALAPEVVLYHVPSNVEVDIDLEFATAVEPDVDPQGSLLEFSTIVREEELATTIHSGLLSDVPNAVAALFRWVGEHQYRANGAFRELHLFGREFDGGVDCRLDPVTVEIQLPFRRS